MFIYLSRRHGGTASWSLYFCIARVFYLINLFRFLQFWGIFYFVVDGTLSFL